MTKVIVGKLAAPRRKGASVTLKRVRGAEGQVKTLHSLDVGSNTFGNDLQYVFRKNVAKARRDNKQILGVPDVAHTRKRAGPALP